MSLIPHSPSFSGYSHEMSTLRATAILARKSGEEIDAVHNVWHFETIGIPTAAHMQKVGSAVGDFYFALSNRLSSSTSRAAAAHRVDFAQVTPGSPGAGDDSVSALLGSYAFSTPTEIANGVDYPGEVAIALSFRGDVAGVPEEAFGGLTRPKSRRRGRVFLGPFSSVVGAKQAVTMSTIVDVAARDLIINSYVAMVAALTDANGTVRHVIYSRADGQLYPVVNAHVDDAFDTIRSRGVTSTTRTTTAIVQPGVS